MSLVRKRLLRSSSVSERKRHVGEMKRMSSCTDCRAWSRDPGDRMEYFMETFNNIGERDTPPRLVPTDVIVDIIMKPKDELINKLSNQLKEFQSNCTENFNNDMNEIMVQVKKLREENEELQQKLDSMSNHEDTEKLREAIRDLRHQVRYLEDCREENTKLKTEIERKESCQKLLDIQAKNDSLTIELDSVKSFRDKYELLKESHESLEKEVKELQRRIHEREKENKLLRLNMDRLQDKFQVCRARRVRVTTITTERDLLVGKLNLRDERLGFFSSLVEDQERQIHELTWKIEKITNDFSAKEDNLMKNVFALQKYSENNSYKMLEYRYKLENSDLLIAELQTLRNQYRLTNGAIIENMAYYQKMFKFIVRYSVKLGLTIKSLQNELQEKDVRIQKLALAPHSGKTVVYFAQLNGLVNRYDVLRDTDPLHVRELLSKLKYIVSQLKLDVWGTEALVPALQLCDEATQTKLNFVTIGSQSELLSIDQGIQTDGYREYVEKYTESQRKVESLTAQMEDLQKSINNKQCQVRELEKQLGNVLNMKTLKEFEIAELENDNLQVKVTLKELKQELEEKNNLLTRVIAELETDLSVSDSTSVLFIKTLEATLEEYKSYSDVLDNYNEVGENKINQLNYLLEKSIAANIQERNELEEKLDSTLDALENEMRTNNVLRGNLNNFQEQLKTKTLELEGIEVGLKEVENLVREKGDTCWVGHDLVGDPVIRLKGFLTNYIDRWEETDRINSILKRQVKDAQCKNRWLKRSVRGSRANNKELKRRVLQMTLSSKRVHKVLKRIRKVFRHSEEKCEDLVRLNNALVEANTTLKVSSGYLEKDVESLRNKLSNMEFNLEANVIKNEEQKLETEKMEKTLRKVVKKLKKYRELCEKDKCEKHTDTSDLEEKDKTTLAVLEACVEQLQERNGDLSRMVDQLEGKLSIFDVETCSNGTQIDFDDKTSEFEEKIQEQLREYEATVEELKKIHEDEKKEASRNYLSNLCILKNTYEKNIKKLKKTHSKDMAKIQVLHLEEIGQLKSIADEGAKQEEEDLRLAHAKEIEEIKLAHKAQVTALEQKLVNDFAQLKDEVQNQLKQKNDEIAETETKAIQALNCMKQKCRNIVKKAQERRKSDADKLKKEFETQMQNKETEIRQRKLKALQFSDTDSFEILVPQEKTFDQLEEDLMSQLKLSNELDELLIDKLEVTKDLPVRDKKVKFTEGGEWKRSEVTRRWSEVLGGGGGKLDVVPVKSSGDDDILSSEDSFKLSSERTQMVVRIKHLESELFNKEKEFEQILFRVERKFREEHTRNLELGSLLNSEIQHNSEIQRRLAFEFDRAEELRLENQTLKRQLASMERKMKLCVEMKDTERAKSKAMKAQLEKILAEQKTVERLEGSLARIQTKLDKAFECEKRLSDELQKERNYKKKLEAAMKINRCCSYPSSSNSSEKFSQADSNGRSDPNLKVVFIQQCGIFHSWKNQLENQQFQPM